jgi:hypothetical protein
MGQTMKRNAAHPALATPFARPMAVGRLSRTHPAPFRIEADAQERAALAGFLGVARVDELSFEGALMPAGAEAWRVRGRMVAALEQTCVVTLAPVPVHLNVELERLYLPEERLPPVREVHVAHDEEDEPDPFSTSIDPAALALESLVLMLDPYPRAEGAELGEAHFGPPGAAPVADAGPHAFAGLAALKRRLGRGRG